MQPITLISGNPGKLAEFLRLWPVGKTLEQAELDLDEIQSLDSKAIVADKARRAYAQIGKPILVDDVSAGLDALHGLPGPFIKFFQERLGGDALYQLGGGNAATTLTCTLGYFDGKAMLYGVGTVHGKVIPASGGAGFGFDFCFVPDGQRQTFAQMGPTTKDKISHRYLAVQDLLHQLDLS